MPIPSSPAVDRPVADHGGALDRAIARFGGTRDGWIDLSTGINPWPYPVPAIPADAWARLPDEAALGGLIAAAREFYGASVDPVAAPGSQALIQLLPRLLPPTEVAVVGPTYAEHARCWALAGHRVVDVAEPVETARVLVLVNPNNPDGRSWSAGDLAQLADRRAARGGLLVIDEAFAEVTSGLTMVPQAGRPGLVVLRSFGKFFGLAGLRLGFAFGTADLMSLLTAAIGPWALSGPALAIGRAALADLAWAAETRAKLTNAAKDLDRILSAAGLVPIGGTALYRLVRTPEAGLLADRLARHHILVRRFDDRPDLLRFGLPPDGPASARLCVALGN